MKPLPFHAQMMPPEVYAALDPGIRFPVRVLNAHGIGTVQSCQGGPGHCYDWPTIDLGGRARTAEGFAALHYLAQFGLPVQDLSYHWEVDQGQPYDNFWRITFLRPMPERADEPFMFIWGYQSQVLPSDRKQRRATIGTPP